MLTFGESREWHTGILTLLFQLFCKFEIMSKYKVKKNEYKVLFISSSPFLKMFFSKAIYSIL